MLSGTQPTVNTAATSVGHALIVRTAPPETTGSEPVPMTEPVPEPEPAPAPTPAPTPEPAVTASAGAGASGTADGSEGGKPKLSPESPVEVGKPGQWAMEFVFGGLGPLSISGTDSHGVNRLLFSQIG